MSGILGTGAGPGMFLSPGGTPGGLDGGGGMGALDGGGVEYGADPLEVVHVVPEMDPFVFRGGLGDVACNLPPALARVGGVKNTVIMPLYKAESGEIDVEKHGLRQMDETVTVPFGFDGGTVEAQLWEKILPVENGPDVRTIFIEADRYFKGKDIYSVYDTPMTPPSAKGIRAMFRRMVKPKPQDTGWDNHYAAGERFAFLAAAALTTMGALGMNPHIIHAHDWTGGLVPVVKKGWGVFEGARTYLSVHNAAYQGIHPAHIIKQLHLDGDRIDVTSFLDNHGNANYLRAGVHHTDYASAVSLHYAKELLTAQFGNGLEAEYERLNNKGRLSGVVNGLGAEWDPSTDPFIARNYSAADMAGKSECRRMLIERYGLKIGADTPILAVHARLTEQKGIDLIDAALPEIVRRNIAVITLGAPDEDHKDMVAKWVKKGRGMVGVETNPAITFDTTRRHELFAGADLFANPARWAPCEITVLYALKYGAIPIVSARGGHVDTVSPFSRRTGKGRGFLMPEMKPAGLLAAIASGLRVWKDPQHRARIMHNMMTKDMSWDRSARDYLKNYERLLASSAIEIPR